MHKLSENLIVISTKYSSESEINRFSKIFHKDFDIMDRDPDDVAIGFFCSLSIEEKASLKKAFIELLDENPGKKQKGIRNAWIKLGAEWRDNRLYLRHSIETWIAKL